MYALFTAIPYVGHLNPLMRQASELTRRGWRAAIAVHQELQPHVRAEAPDVAVVDLGPLGALRERLRACEEAASIEPDYAKGARKIMPLLTDTFPSTFDGVVASIARDRPDVVIYDIFTAGGYAAAFDAGVPFVINDPSLLNAVPLQLLPPAPHIPFVTTGRSIHEMRWIDRAIEPLLRHAVNLVVAMTLGRELNALMKARGRAPIDGHTILRGRPILVEGVFGLEYERPIPEYVHMVGPMLPREIPAESPDLLAWLADGPPVVYANLGTVAKAPNGQVEKMADAFAIDGVRVLWVMRDALRGRLPPSLASNVRVVNWLESPRAVLAHPNVRVFVSHCGMNSVYESISAGTPIVGIPMFSDQRDMAVRVSDAGAGLWMDKTTFTASQLREAIARVLSNDSFRERITPIQAAIAASGGITRAADIIEAEARAA
jgi:UDP:flavonoid glycosyltransferase YjiC (YdhE family)